MWTCKLQNYFSTSFIKFSIPPPPPSLYLPIFVQPCCTWLFYSIKENFMLFFFCFHYYFYCFAPIIFFFLNFFFSFALVRIFLGKRSRPEIIGHLWSSYLSLSLTFHQKTSTPLASPTPRFQRPFITIKVSQLFIPVQAKWLFASNCSNFFSKIIVWRSQLTH